MKIDRYSDLNIEDKTLSPYQQKAKKEIFESWDEVNSVMFQMPTGTGKTRLFTSIIHDINENSQRRKEPVKILVVAHRAELIDQIDASLKKYSVAHNVIAGGREKNYKYPVSVASIQTITNAKNLEEVKKLNLQFVIIDEAHHALAKTYKKLWDLYPNAKFLGVTATPWRMNHQSFTDLFDRLILSMSIKDFIKQGYLSPYKYFSLKSDSDIQRTIDGIELDKFGEYKEDSMEEKMDIGSIRVQLLDSYLKLAEGKKGIIYAINIAHAKHICEEYKSKGYNVVCIDSKTPQQINENREFFHIQVNQPKAILELFHHTDVNEEVTDEIQNNLTDDDKAASAKAQPLRPAPNFHEMDMQRDDVLIWKDDPLISVTVISERKVNYKGEETSISALSAQLKGYKSKHIVPGAHWLFNDRFLSEIYDETYPFEY